MDVSHELGALRFVVDSSLSSKVAMFNQQVDQHKQSQLLNPFSNTDGRSSPKPSFSKDEYGKPLAGSLTEMRGQKANMHVLKEMLELCQIIDSEGYNVKDEPTMRVIPFGELFNIYNYISDKVVGILLRARKHKLVEFEGEMLFQRRDDDVPIFLIKPIREIRRETEEKIESIKRCGSPAPQATAVLLDKKAHGLDVPRGATPRSSVSRTPSPQSSKAATPVRETKAKSAAAEPTLNNNSDKSKSSVKATKAEVVENKPNESITTTAGEVKQTPKETLPNKDPQPAEDKEKTKLNGVVVPQEQQSTIREKQTSTLEATTAATTTKTDDNNNSNNTKHDLPTIIIEATAVNEGSAKTEEASVTDNDITSTISAATTESNNVQSTALVESTPSA